MATELSTRVLEMGRAGGNELLTTVGETGLGYQTYARGDLVGARPLLEAVLDRDCTKDPALAFIFGVDPRVACLMHLAVTLLYLGYPDAARRRIGEAEERARGLDQPVSEAMVPWIGWVVAARTGDDQTSRRFTDWLVELASEHGNPVHGVYGQTYRALEQARRDPSGPARTPKLAAHLEATGWRSFETGFRLCVALEHSFLGNVSEALAAFDTALELTEAMDERLNESYIHLGKGQLLAATASVEQAEACFDKAIAVARKQHARFQELEAATALARVWQGQGKRGEALELLRPVYDWFTEGFDTSPLIEARELLEELEIA
jgi:tetratricopeptide (TPR) repeat protein